MPERGSTAGTVVSLVFAVLFVMFAVWTGLRAADAWVSGSRGMAALYGLGALGGLSLAVHTVRRALIPVATRGPS